MNTDDAALLWPDRRLHAVDVELFSFYFLMAESLSTFVGYRIAQHCLRGCRVWFLSPSSRMAIGVVYCVLKIRIIDYAFRDSAYFICSLMIMVWYLIYAVQALGFHQGPLQFLFFDYLPKSQMTQCVYDRAANVCRHVKNRLEYYVLQQIVDVPTSRHLESSDTQSSSIEGNVARLAICFGREMHVNIEEWNGWMQHNWLQPMVTSGRSRAVHRGPPVDAFEARFVFLMQRNGLILAIFLTHPTATLMEKLSTKDATPFELVVRYHCQTSRDLEDTYPYFLYAETPMLVGVAGSGQRAATYELLKALNATLGYVVDVPLRSLRTKNFIEAGVGLTSKKDAKERKRKAQRPTLSMKMAESLG